MILINNLYRKYFINNSLYKNSIFLILGTLVTALLGFIFWILNARLFSPNDLGIATTTISAATLVSSFSLLGFNNSLVRFLPKAKNKSEKISSGLLIVTIVTLLLSILYLSFINILSPKLNFFLENHSYELVFIIFTLFLSYSNIVDSIFIAYRGSKNVLVKSSIQSILKIIFPLFFVSLGFLGIILALTFSTISGVIFAIALLYINYGYRFSLQIESLELKRTIHYSFGNYLVNFFSSLPLLVIPIIVTVYVGTEYSAYYYIDAMIINLLYIIPSSITNSFFAEGSYGDENLRQIFKNSIKLVYAILIPGIVGIILLGYYVLLIFGKDYADNGYSLLILLATSSIFYSINNLLLAIFRIKHKIKILLFINILGSFFILLCCIIFARFNLTGIGLSWLAGQFLLTIIYTLFSLKTFKL